MLPYVYLYYSWYSNAKLTLNQEEEAEDSHSGDDDARNNEGHAPGGCDKRSGDERAQDVPHRGVRVPHAHDEPSPTATANEKYIHNWFFHLYISHYTEFD